MTNPVAQVRHHANLDGSEPGSALWMWCPGCDMAHRVGLTGRRPLWEWDGNLEQPTISPSILCHGSVHRCGPRVVHYTVCPDPDSCGQPGHYISPEGPAHVFPCPHGLNGDCHSFVRNGQWEFLSDSAHALAGQTVPMVSLPDWLRKETD